MLTVTDKGCGMDAETQARIFEPFFTTKGPGRGTGLGLATVYGVVKQSGGYIWVYSEVGHGTTFKVYLPRVAASCRKAPLPKSASLAPSPGTETILFVEDEAERARVGREYLRPADITSSRPATELRRSKSPNSIPARIQLLITDVVMPS